MYEMYEDIYKSILMCEIEIDYISELLGDRGTRRGDEVRPRAGKARPRATEPSAFREVRQH